MLNDNGDVISPRQAAAELLAYCRQKDWSGYDPYDALNSEWLKKFSVFDGKVVRIGLIQALKRSPIDVRGLLRVPPTQNPKALALFLSAALKLSKAGLLNDDDLPRQLGDKLIALRSPGEAYWCWGYSFPWQTRTVLVPAGAPNLVCTIFVVNALLDLYDEQETPSLLEVATNAADYLLDRLYFSEPNGVASFAYPLPASKSKVHNANLLAAALLARLFHHTGNERYREVALETAAYSVSRQNSDGSWFYGESRGQGWIDNFHTGYNLGALRAIAQNLGTSEFDGHAVRGFRFYRDHFFREDGAVRYFHDRTYPIDIHCIAQSIVTLLEFEELDETAPELIEAIYGWAMRHMRDQSGFFYYRVLRWVTIKTCYMRWSQAWMLFALALLASREEATNPRVRQSSSVAAMA